MHPVQAFCEYCHLEGLSPKTIQGYRAAVRIFGRQCPDLLAVDSTQTLAFFSKGKSCGFSQKAPASPTNYNNIRSGLNKFYRWAVDYGYAESNPIAKIPRCKMPKTLPRRLTDQQKIIILYHAQNFPHPSTYIRSRNYAIVSTLLMTGLRAQELLSLRNEDINLKEQSLRVRSGKGRKERLVYFSNELPPILRDYLEEKRRLSKESLWFFTSYRSNLPIRYRNFRDIIARISKLSRIRFSAHWLRHTCFSNLAEQDVDLRSIQAQAGHASIISTQIYTHVADKIRKEKVRKVTFLHRKH